MRQINPTLCRASVLALWVGCASYGVSVDSASSGAPNADDAIARSGYVSADDAKLFLTVRGDSRRAPVLLFVHGGPGGAERPLFRYYDSTLEQRFVVAYWDQRGAGRSFDPDADPRKLTIARHLADLDIVVAQLQQEFGRRITLVGHSWGAALALLYAHSHPERIAAVIAVAPLVDTVAQQKAQYDFVVAEAQRRDDRHAQERLRAIGAPPHRSAENVLAMEALADRYGGVYHSPPNRVGAMLGGVVRGLVTPWEIPRFIKGNNVSLAAMNDELLTLHLAERVPTLDVPVFFILGRYDRHADSLIAAQYLESLQAPVKRVVWFEQSAHNIPFEEPAEFTDTVVQVLASAGVSDVLNTEH
jgi:proline iminopeptidase